MKSMQSLDGQWELAYFPECEGMPQTPEELRSWNCPRIPAMVPGNVEFDLGRAGEVPPEEDIMKALNINALRKYECYQWWYRRKFPTEDIPGSGRMELTFEGIDCYGTVWLNGVELGRTRNAKLRYTFDVTDVLKPYGGENELTVRLSAPLNMVRDKNYDTCFGYSAKFDGLYIRKPFHAFGTDICPRLLTAGLWRSVTLRRKPEYSIRDMSVWTWEIAPDGKARLFVEATIDIPRYASYEGLTTRVRCVCGDSVADENVEFTRELSFAHFEMPWIEIPHAKLWYPAELGEQPLYDVTLEVFLHGKPVASQTVKYGIRKVELDRSDLNLPDKPGRFLFKINGVPLFVRGNNWIWADIFHSRDKNVLMKKLELFKEANCNMIRLHGSGVYEPPEFYDFCDRNGILVWQDLGMTGVSYPQSDEFAELIGEEVRFAIKELRNHPSVAVWCGDNEADSMRACGWMGRRIHPDTNRITRKTVAELVSCLAPNAIYLPSSPYLHGECADRIMKCRGFETNYLSPEAHLWGPRDYCKSDFYFKNNRNIFASEMGFFSANNLSLIQKYLSPDKLWPQTNNPEWNYHSTESFQFRNGTQARVLQTGRQIQNYFGEVPPDAETFIKASQIVLAESDKFVAELYRQKKWEKTGLLLWNMVDSWPQTVSDAWVDSDLNKKLVFHYMKRSYRPFLLLCAEPENGKLPLIAVNDTCHGIGGTAKITLPDTGSSFEISFHAEPNSNSCFGELPVPDGAALILLEWIAEAPEYSGCNHYISGVAPLPLTTYLRNWLPQIAALDQSFIAENVGI